MVTELQRLVDALAQRTNRSLVLEDRRQRMIVYSEHPDPIDQVRSESILSRRTRPEVVAWFARFAIADAREPVRTPPSPELGSLGRVCFPIRHDDLLLGFLWFVDPDGSMTDAEIAAVADSLEAFSLSLYRENLAGELARSRDAEVVRNLLAAEPGLATYASQELIAEGHLPERSTATATVAWPVLIPGAEPDELLRLAIEQALVATRRQVGSRRSLQLVRFDHGVLITTAVTQDEAAELAVMLRDELLRSCEGLASVARVVVGIGTSRERLDDVRTSYTEARQAVDVALHLAAAGPVAQWSRLGIYRALSQLSSEHLEAATIHPGLSRLLADEGSQMLADTLEVYLDLAGSAQATAEHLGVHRTSLYHRLARIEQLCETDLKDGQERLALHLGLKLARLAGRR